MGEIDAVLAREWDKFISNYTGPDEEWGVAWEKYKADIGLDDALKLGHELNERVRPMVAVDRELDMALQNLGLGKVDEVERSKRLIAEAEKLLGRGVAPGSSRGRRESEGFTAGRWDPDKGEWTTEPLSTGDAPDPDTGLTAGAWDEEKKRWVTRDEEEEANPDSALTAGRWNREKKRWER